MPRAATSVGDADLGAAVTQGLERGVALALAELARQGDRREAALGEHRLEVPHGVAGVAEDDGGGRIGVAQGVDHHVLDLARHHPHGAVGDVGMAALLALHGDAQGIVLVALGQTRDRLRQGRGEEQGAPLLRGHRENEFEVIAKTEIEHLVGLVEDGDAQVLGGEVAALQMVAQAARRADDDMGALGESPALAARVHAADAGDDARSGLGIEPFELALDLKREFARRGDDEGQRRAGRIEPLGIAEERFGEGEAIGDGLAGTGLGRDEEVAALGRRLDHGTLDGGRVFVVAGLERSDERGPAG